MADCVLTDAVAGREGEVVVVPGLPSEMVVSGGIQDMPPTAVIAQISSLRTTDDLLSVVIFAEQRIRVDGCR